VSRCGTGHLAFLRLSVSTHLDELFPSVNHFTHLNRLAELFLTKVRGSGRPFWAKLGVHLRSVGQALSLSTHQPLFLT